MYFDNYLKPNHPPITQKIDPSSISLFHQPSHTGFDPVQHNQRPFFNPRMTENTTVPSPGVNKNVDDQAKYYVGYPTGVSQNNSQRQQSFQVKNNVSFNSELSNSNLTRQTGDFMKRRESITQNTFLRSNQQHSPSHGKNLMSENGMKSNLKMMMTNQQYKNIQQGQKHSGSITNISNLSSNGFTEQQYGLVREQKDTIQQKQDKDKQGYFASSNFSQYGFSENKLSSKPYAAGFKTGGDNFEFDSKKGQQGYLKDKSFQQKEKHKQQDKDFMYNFQLKNITSDLNIFGKYGNTTSNTSGTNEQQKYYTPCLTKKSSQKQDSSFINKSGFSQLVDIRHNNNMMERENTGKNLTEREITKSPSFDTLLSNGIVKENFRSKLQSTMENQHQQNQSGSNQHQHQFSSSNSLISQPNSKQPSQSLISNQPYSSKPPSQSYLPQLTQKFPKQQQNSKNYHQLIQNLQKKFSQQKKSSQSFQTKEKTYIAQLNKKDDKIKRLETIIDNNKETIAAMEETIKQLRRKNQEEREDIKQRNSGLVEEMKRENASLREQIRRQRKKSVSLAEQALSKELSEKQEANIRELQKTLTELSKDKQTLSIQITKLKDLNSQIQQNYCTEIKNHQSSKQQHQRTKQQLKIITQQKDHLQKSYQQKEKTHQQKLQSFNQVKLMLSNLEQKYQGSLQKLLFEEEQFQKEKKLVELKGNQIQKLNAKIERLEKEISLKVMNIKTLEKNLSEKQNQLHNALTSNQLSINSTLSYYKQQAKTAKQTLKKNQLTSQHQSQLLIQKDQQINKITKDKYSLESKVQQITKEKHALESKLKQMESNFLTLALTVSSYESAKIEESPKKNTDSAEIKTLASDSGKDFSSHKETLSLLELYHEKYLQIIALFNLNDNSQKSAQQQSSLTVMPHQHIQPLQTSTTKLHPSRQYLTQYHPLLTQQVKKVLKDMKKLLNVLKQCEAESQQKTQRLYQLDKTLKKQGNKINAIMGEIHLKNMTILDINHMQVEKDIFRLNEKYQILNHVV